MLREAGVPLDDATINRLPTWTEITNLYGPEPVIYGLERCEAFRANNLNNPEVLLSPQGLFNTGTRHLRQLLESNCEIAEVGNPFWWKHAPAQFAHKKEMIYRKDNTHKDLIAPQFQGNFMRNVMSVVSIKEPFFWMGSMCRNRYNVRWDYDERHCPEFNPVEPRSPIVEYDVHTDTTSYTLQYANMVDLWNQFHKGHFNAAHPRLMIRYEDTIFHPKTVVKQVCECAGGIMRNKFNFRIQTTKSHNGGPENMLVAAMIKYGSVKMRLDGFTVDDAYFGKAQLDKELTAAFHYSLP
eukprot:CAMPEP_0172513402 /NCGR_PEP_ID=MMETSP1066-20121228/252328_1 /TAXON_ID=671091 /ORGANISM="Coscinodiscus wailesii, Strain CCMP2513" /LENGTH=295 /DNA_ID=CAMNT_0013293657 /DNA_START=373 /DNA_END=1260 /DNA_ORIENTATION=-